MKGWSKIADQAGRRLSVHVGQTPEAGAAEADVAAAKEAATILLGLPWELLTRPGIPGNLHDHAWDHVDRLLVGLMRQEGQT